MISKHYRFPTKQLFTQLRHTGRYLQNPQLTVLYQPNNTLHSRVTIIIGKRVHKQAHQRNQIKRRLAHACKDKWDFSRPFDIVLLPKPPINQSTYTQVTTQLNQLLTQII